jgi:uncharacterized protein with NRDE domain
MIVFFKKIPSIMCVGGFSPEFDFDGKLVQTLGKSDVVYDQVSVSILVSNGRGAVAIAWHKDALFKDSFAASLISKRQEILSSLVIQLAFEHMENTCMNIPWWDQLKAIEKEMLLRRMQIAGSFYEGRESKCLEYDGVTHDQWEYDSHHFEN